MNTFEAATAEQTKMTTHAPSTPAKSKRQTISPRNNERIVRLMYKDGIAKEDDDSDKAISESSPTITDSDPSSVQSVSVERELSSKD